MGKKILLNIFYNIAIFVLALTLIWLFTHKHYALIVPTAFIIALFVYFKIRLIKEVKELTRKP